MYIYIYVEREREGEQDKTGPQGARGVPELDALPRGGGRRRRTNDSSIITSDILGELITNTFDYRYIRRTNDISRRRRTNDSDDNTTNDTTNNEHDNHIVSICRSVHMCVCVTLLHLMCHTFDNDDDNNKHTNNEQYMSPSALN